MKLRILLATFFISTNSFALDGLHCPTREQLAPVRVIESVYATPNQYEPPRIFTLSDPITIDNDIWVMKVLGPFILGDDVVRHVNQELEYRGVYGSQQSPGNGCHYTLSGSGPYDMYHDVYVYHPRIYRVPFYNVEVNGSIYADYHFDVQHQTLVCKTVSGDDYKTTVGWKHKGERYKDTLPFKLKSEWADPDDRLIFIDSHPYNQLFVSCEYSNK